MNNCNLITTLMELIIKLNKDTNYELVDGILYNQIIDSLRYMCNTIPNIFHCVGLVSRLMEEPKSCHLLATKRILIYIKDNANHRVLIPNQENSRKEAKVYGYSNSVWGRRSRW